MNISAPPTYGGSGRRVEKKARRRKTKGRKVTQHHAEHVSLEDL